MSGRRQAPPAAPVAPNAFEGKPRQPSADALKAGGPPPPPPPTALHAVPLRPEPDAEISAASTAPAVRTDDRPVDTAALAPVPADTSVLRDTNDDSHPMGERASQRTNRVRDWQSELDDLIRQAVSATRDQNRDAISEIVTRLKSIVTEENSPAALAKLLAAVASVPVGGKVPTPLEIAPHLHQKLKAEATANRARGKVPTMTGIVLQAIGEVHESGRLTELVAAHKAGERHNVPLFGQLVAGTAPRGTTLRMQFQPTSTAKIVAEILAAWHQVDFVVLVRLALEAHYKPARKAKTAQTVVEGDPSGMDADSDETAVTG